MFKSHFILINPSRSKEFYNLVRPTGGGIKLPLPPAYRLLWYTGASFQLFLGGGQICLNFSMPPDYWKIGKKQHFICSNLTLFIVPFFLFSLFFLFFLFPWGGGGRRPPSPPKWRLWWYIGRKFQRLSPCFQGLEILASHSILCDASGSQKSKMAARKQEY